MLANFEIKVTRAEQSKLKGFTLENLPFGKYFSDHMLEADYVNGEWTHVEIKPYQPLLLNPGLSALHYGQAIFEGIKAFRDHSGNAWIFRPEDNHRRFNVSATRLQMPEVPAGIFLEGMRQLVALEKKWIPEMKDHSLYIRPFMFATDDTLGVHPSNSYKFLIILSPAGPYYPKPMRIYVEERYTRAAPGGVGYAKAAGNYAAALLPTAEAQQKGYDQVLWTDAIEHKYAQEIGTMNVFFVLKDKVLTPDLKSETILAGVTRDTVINLLRELGHTVEEGQINIEDIIAAYKKGELLEVFGTGTAATVAMIRELRYKDFTMDFNTDTWKVCTSAKKRLDAIRSLEHPDTHGWMFRV